MVLNERKKPPIKIPSENNYQLENQKVIDNQVNRIEVTVKSPQLVNDTHNVYTVSSPTSSFIPNVAQTNQATQMELMENYGTDFYGAYISVIPTYYRNNFKIQKNDKNSRIVNLLLKANDNGYPNISVVLSGTVERGSFTGKANISNINVNKRSFRIDSFNIDNLYPSSKNDTNYELFHTDKTYSNTLQWAGGINPKKVTTSLSFTNEDNILSVEPTEETKDYFILDVIVLIGLEVYMPKIYTHSDSIITFPSQVDIVETFNNSSVNKLQTSEYEKYTCKNINITVDGNVIELDLQDTPLVFGDGGNILSLNGNELMQTSSIYGNIDIAKYSSSPADTEGYRKIGFNVRNTDITYDELVVGMMFKYKDEFATITKITGVQQGTGNKTIECKCLADGKFYNSLSYIYFNVDILSVSIPPFQIIRDWGKGKESATIRCGIADYYDTNGDMVISAETINFSDITYLRSQEESLYYTAKCDKEVAVGTRLKYAYIETYGDELKYDYVTVTEVNGDTITIETYYDDYFRELVDESDTIKVATDLPMVFDIGDIDLPYVRGANGIDKPMSKYANGQAKEFEVISSTITYDGAIWQTLDEIETKK